MNENALKFLGLLYSGKQVSIGDSAINDIKRNKSKLVLIAADASELTKKEVMSAAFNKVNVSVFSTKVEIGYAIGKGNIAVVSINSSKAAKAFLEKI